MLQIHCPERLSEALQHGRTIGEYPSLKKALRHLSHWGESGFGGRHKTTCHVYPDFAPHSFQFSVTDNEKGQAHLVGGIIYHGASKGEEVNNFSCVLEPTAGWRIHT
jgi:hypothetical protein